MKSGACGIAIAAGRSLAGLRGNLLSADEPILVDVQPTERGIVHAGSLDTTRIAKLVSGVQVDEAGEFVDGKGAVTIGVGFSEIRGGRFAILLGGGDRYGSHRERKAQRGDLE